MCSITQDELLEDTACRIEKLLEIGYTMKKGESDWIDKFNTVYRNHLGEIVIRVQILDIDREMLECNLHAGFAQLFRFVKGRIDGCYKVNAYITRVDNNPNMLRVIV